jgi:hypothetical protein
MKIRADVRGELAVRRVVGGLDADDPRLQRGVVLLSVADKVKLRHGRPNQENLVRAPQRGGYGPKEVMLIVRMIVRTGLLIFRVTMNVVSFGVDEALIDGCTVDVKDLRHVVIHPHRHLPHRPLLARRRPSPHPNKTPTRASGKPGQSGPARCLCDTRSHHLGDRAETPA